jgi:glycosyltransferase involved in cell wall biosynthesis
MADSLARQDIIVTATPYNRFLIPQDPQLKPSQIAFNDVILGAKFSLCPRGNGAGSYRLQESMALGRAPVIISDDWVPVADLAWERFAVFVAEDSLHDLPAILREYEPHWKDMGELARQTYESHFSRKVFASRAVEQIVAIYKVRRHDERHFFSRWDQMMDDAGCRLGQ